MVLLNLFSKKFTLLTIFVSTGFLTVPATAGTLSLFDPNHIKKENQEIELNTQLLLVNDAFSLEVLFDDLEGSLHDQDKRYNAIGDARIDIGSHLDFLGYVGYTYRKEVVMPASSDTLLSGKPTTVIFSSAIFRNTISLGVVTPSTGFGNTT